MSKIILMAKGLHVNVLWRGWVQWVQIRFWKAKDAGL